MTSKEIGTKTFGSTQRAVTRVGLGGEGMLRTQGRDKEARIVISAALNQGITYFDSARVYSDSEVYLGTVWGYEPKTREKVFQTSKSARRDKAGALFELRESLKRLQTNYLDLWQIHDVRTKEDIRNISGPGGALEAFVEAKDKGLVKAIGVTGHHDPQILTEAVKEWPVDSVMLPVNPVEGVLANSRPESFLSTTLDAAKKKGIAVIGMKTLGAAQYIFPDGGITAQILLRYALSWDITVAIVGCSSAEHVEILAAEGRGQKPLSDQDQRELEKAFEPHARRMAYYRGAI